MHPRQYQPFMAALDRELEGTQGETSAAGCVDTAAASAGRLLKSYSQGALSAYEGDFERVEMAEASSPAPPVKSSGGWFGWGAAAAAPKANKEE